MADMNAIATIPFALYQRIDWIFFDFRSIQFFARSPPLQAKCLKTSFMNNKKIDNGPAQCTGEKKIEIETEFA